MQALICLLMALCTSDAGKSLTIPIPQIVVQQDCAMPPAPDFYFPDMLPLATAACPFGSYADLACLFACDQIWTDCKNAAIADGNAGLQALHTGFAADWWNCETVECECMIVEEYEAAIRGKKAQIVADVQACNDARYNCTWDCCEPWNSVKEPTLLAVNDPEEDCNFPPPTVVSANQTPPAPVCPVGYGHDFGCRILCEGAWSTCLDAAYLKASTGLAYIWQDRYAIWAACTTAACRCETVSEYEMVKRGVLKEYIRDLGKCSDAYLACCALCCEELEEVAIPPVGCYVFNSTSDDCALPPLSWPAVPDSIFYDVEVHCPVGQTVSSVCKKACFDAETACLDDAIEGGIYPEITAQYAVMTAAYNACDDDACRCQVVAAWKAFKDQKRTEMYDAIMACQSQYADCLLACCN